MRSAGGYFNHWIARTLVYVLPLVLSIAAFHYGIILRRAAWDWTDGVHFQGDVSNAFRWGARAHNGGLDKFYDNLDKGNFENPTLKSDYPPLRITMATLWREVSEKKYPGVSGWQDDYDFTYPMLQNNIIAEASSSLLVFIIILIWKRRCACSQLAWHTGLLSATLGMLAFWFNPAIIWDGHCWPQWDVWLIPFFLLAILCYMLDFCLIAGISIAIGACLKGQMLLAAPILILVPIFSLDFSKAFRIVTGFLFGMAAIVFPFMQASQPAFHWLFRFWIALAIVLPIAMNWYRKYRWIQLVLLAIACLIAYPWESPAAEQWTQTLLKLAYPTLLLLAISGRLFKPNLRVHFYIASIAIAIFLLMPIFGASDAWYRYGFAYGTEKFADMMTGTGTYNLLAMSRVYLGWPRQADEMVDLGYIINTQLNVTDLSRIIYFVLLVLCAIGASIHYRRKDPRFVASLVAPWLMFYMIITQMHGRYPVWAAGMSALLFAIGNGMGLLGMLVSIVAMLGIAHNQLAFQRDWWPAAIENLRAVHPHLGWILLLAMLIYLYHALLPTKRSEL